MLKIKDDVAVEAYKKFCRTEGGKRFVSALFAHLAEVNMGQIEPCALRENHGGRKVVRNLIDLSGLTGKEQHVDGTKRTDPGADPGKPRHSKRRGTQRFDESGSGSGENT